MEFKKYRVESLSLAGFVTYQTDLPMCARQCHLYYLGDDEARNVIVIFGTNSEEAEAKKCMKNCSVSQGWREQSPAPPPPAPLLPSVLGSWGALPGGPCVCPRAGHRTLSCSDPAHATRRAWGVGRAGRLEPPLPRCLSEAKVLIRPSPRPRGRVRGRATGSMPASRPGVPSR